ncbi:MAG: zinc-ribbon domain-containing protein, partial [Methanobrevibacter sp.]|nr:zinc-ribbon domain-containing protein [Methanobrevibacter sp.]
MMMSRCPQCGTTTDDMCGFCIKCGYEFPKMEASADTCPLCGFQNPPEADYCVKCGTPLVFKKQFQGDPNSNLNPIVIKKEISNNA